MTQLAQDRFSHLGAGAVLSAEKEDAQGSLNPHSLLESRFGDRSGESRVKLLCGSEIADAELLDVQAVEDGPLIRATSAFRDQVFLTKLLQVVRNRDSVEA